MDEAVAPEMGEQASDTSSVMMARQSLDSCLLAIAALGSARRVRWRRPSMRIVTGQRTSQRCYLSPELKFETIGHVRKVRDHVALLRGVVWTVV